MIHVLKDYIFWMLYYAVEIYSWLIFVYIIAGFFVTNRFAGWFVFLQELCEPSLRFVRRITRNRLVVDRFDLSPILLFFGLRLFQVLLTYLFQMG